MSILEIERKIDKDNIRALTGKGQDPETKNITQPLEAARIKRQVSVRAAKEGSTQRAIILTGLRAIGIDVNDKDLQDKRKVR